jgi:hypothetical protein
MTILGACTAPARAPWTVATAPARAVSTREGRQHPRRTSAPAKDVSTREGRQHPRRTSAPARAVGTRTGGTEWKDGEVEGGRAERRTRAEGSAARRRMQYAPSHRHVPVTPPTPVSAVRAHVSADLAVSRQCRRNPCGRHRYGRTVADAVGTREARHVVATVATRWPRGEPHGDREARHRRPQSLMSCARPVRPVRPSGRATHKVPPLAPPLVVGSRRGPGRCVACRTCGGLLNRGRDKGVTGDVTVDMTRGGTRGETRAAPGRGQSDWRRSGAGWGGAGLERVKGPPVEPAPSPYAEADPSVGFSVWPPYAEAPTPPQCAAPRRVRCVEMRERGGRKREKKRERDKRGGRGGEGGRGGGRERVPCAKQRRCIRYGHRRRI